jgi:hypothetical protein
MMMMLPLVFVIVDIDFVLWLLHDVAVDDIADVLDIFTSIFRVELRAFVSVCKYLHVGIPSRHFSENLFVFPNPEKNKSRNLVNGKKYRNSCWRIKVESKSKKR